MTRRDVYVGRIPAEALAAYKPVDPIAKAVDDYLLMERKARAWDELRAVYAPIAGVVHAAEVVATMDALVHPAPAPSKG